MRPPFSTVASVGTGSGCTALEAVLIRRDLHFTFVSRPKVSTSKAHFGAYKQE